MQYNSEINYLTELIKDFPPENPIGAKKALDILSVRYEELEKNITAFLNAIKNPPQQLYKFPLSKLIVGNDYFPALFYLFGITIHRYLFSKILNNPGKYRNSTDPGNGRVGFGGNNPRMLGSFKFSGEKPDKIITKLNEAFMLLRSNSVRPIEVGLEFYRRFVRIHPFYDANGRTGRLLLSIYLKNFDLNILWREIETGGNKTKFIQKLNACHKRENQFIYPIYFNYLLKLFEKFVVQIDQFNCE